MRLRVDEDPHPREQGQGVDDDREEQQGHAPARVTGVPERGRRRPEDEHLDDWAYHGAAVRRLR